MLVVIIGVEVPSGRRMTGGAGGTLRKDPGRRLGQEQGQKNVSDVHAGVLYVWTVTPSEVRASQRGMRL